MRTSPECAEAAQLGQRTEDRKGSAVVPAVLRRHLNKRNKEVASRFHVFMELKAIKESVGGVACFHVLVIQYFITLWAVVLET